MKWFGQIYTERRADRAQEFIRHLYQNTGTVPRIWFTTAGAAMIQVDEHGQSLLDDFVGLFALYVDHESDAAGVVFKLWIVEALLFGWSVVCHLVTFETDFFELIVA